MSASKIDISSGKLQIIYFIMTDDGFFKNECIVTILQKCLNPLFGKKAEHDFIAFSVS